MNATARRFAKHSAIGLSVLLGLGCVAASEAGAQVLPPNPSMSCTVPQATFNGWFASGSPSLNGPVNPASSIAFQSNTPVPPSPPNTVNCNFYQWSAQMFLWLTSPATGQYSGGRVLSSNVFYQLNGNNLVAQVAGAPLNLTLRAAQVGPDGLPVVLDTKGHIREFVTAPSTGGGMLLGPTAGAKAQAFKVQRGTNGKAVFLDRAGKPLNVVPSVAPQQLPKNISRLIRLIPQTKGLRALSATAVRQQIAAALTKKHVLIKFGTGNSSIFVEAGTSIIDNLGPGQAGGNGVLISQKGSVIFYETIVNDVYAWYLTGRKTPGGIAPLFDPNNPATNGLFPTSQTDLNSILAFSQSHGGPSSFPDQNALAMEMKLSWVDASTVPNPQTYITTPAMVPTYNRSNSTDWSPAGNVPMIVALVGAHVVGSVTGHPELVWATFEHTGNTPLSTYQYVNSSNQTVTVNQNTSGNWLFSATGASGPFNSELASYVPPGTSPPPPSEWNHIVSTASPPAPITASNILRMKPWGVASNGVPNQANPTPAAANTEIISIDTNIQNMLAAAGASADPRYSYLQIGATWTLGGGEPNGPYPAGVPLGSNDVIGTSFLLNSTMETYQQGTDSTYSTGNDCFACHTAAGSNPQVKADTSVSHIFANINPLSLTAELKKKKM